MIEPVRGVILCIHYSSQLGQELTVVQEKMNDAVFVILY
jgi:hypothetical protein